METALLRLQPWKAWLRHTDIVGAAGSCSAAELHGVVLVTDDNPDGKKNIKERKQKSGKR